MTLKGLSILKDTYNNPLGLILNPSDQGQAWQEKLCVGVTPSLQVYLGFAIPRGHIELWVIAWSFITGLWPNFHIWCIKGPPWTYQKHILTEKQITKKWGVFWKSSFHKIFRGLCGFSEQPPVFLLFIDFWLFKHY